MVVEESSTSQTSASSACPAVMARRINALKEPIMRDRRDGVHLRRQLDLGLCRLLPAREAVRPALGQDRVHAALHDRINHDARHGLRVGHDDAPEPNVHDLLPRGVGAVEELDEVVWGCPFLSRYVGIVQEPIS